MEQPGGPQLKTSPETPHHASYTNPLRRWPRLRLHISTRPDPLREAQDVAQSYWNPPRSEYVVGSEQPVSERGANESRVFVCRNGIHGSEMAANYQSCFTGGSRMVPHSWGGSILGIIERGERPEYRRRITPEKEYCTSQRTARIQFILYGTSEFISCARCNAEAGYSEA